MAGPCSLFTYQVDLTNRNVEDIDAFLDSVIFGKSKNIQEYVGVTTYDDKYVYRFVLDFDCENDTVDLEEIRSRSKSVCEHFVNYYGLLDTPCKFRVVHTSRTKTVDSVCARRWHVHFTNVSAPQEASHGIKNSHNVPFKSKDNIQMGRPGCQRRFKHVDVSRHSTENLRRYHIL